MLEGAFRLLGALSDVGAERQVSALALRTGLPRSAVHRLLAQLRAVGAVGENLHGRLVLAPALLGLSRHVEPSEGLRLAAAGVMQAVR